jgi:hypothetical protein
MVVSDQDLYFCFTLSKSEELGRYIFEHVKQELEFITTNSYLYLLQIYIYIYISVLTDFR